MANCPTDIVWVPSGHSNRTELTGWVLSTATTSNTDNCKLYVLAMPFGSGTYIVLVYKNQAEKDYTYAHIRQFMETYFRAGGQAGGGLAAVITPNVVAAGQYITATEPVINRVIPLQTYNNSGLSGHVYWNGDWHYGNVGGTIYYGNAPVIPTPATTTTTTTYPGPQSTTTTTLPTTTTTTTPLLDAQVIQYLNDGLQESVTARRGAFNYGTIAPGETSETIIVSLFAPHVKAMNNIQLGLIDTGGIEFSTNVFCLATSLAINPTAVPIIPFLGVNNTSSSTSNFNFGIQNRDSHTSAYVYLNATLPRDNFLGSGTIRYKWFFDFSD